MKIWLKLKYENINSRKENGSTYFTLILRIENAQWTHWKRPWCWERLKAGGEGDNRGWDGWMASRTQWTWVWANSGSWWWTGRPGMLQSMESQRVGHDWVTELNWMNKSLFSLLHFFLTLSLLRSFPSGTMVKNSHVNTGDSRYTRWSYKL